MASDGPLVTLQKQQREHDLGYHRDIYFLSHPNKMKHYVFHFSKYVGRLAAGPFMGDSGPQSWATLLADAGIVALAAADVVHLRLDEKLPGDTRARSVKARAATLANRYDAREGEVQAWLMRRMAVYTGRMAKAMESLDHMENFDVRGTLERSIIDLLADLLAASNVLKIDLESLIRVRWKQIEDRNVL